MKSLHTAYYPIPGKWNALDFACFYVFVESNTVKYIDSTNSEQNQEYC